jgi:hypothetical protein
MNQRWVQAGRAGHRGRAPGTPAPQARTVVRRHLFYSACTVSLGTAPGELVAREIAMFITGRALIIAGKGCRAQVMPTGGTRLRWR